MRTQLRFGLCAGIIGLCLVASASSFAQTPLAIVRPAATHSDCDSRSVEATSTGSHAAIPTIADDIRLRLLIACYSERRPGESIVVAQATDAGAAVTVEASTRGSKATPKLAQAYEGQWRRANPGRDLTAGMSFKVLSQDGPRATGKFTSFADGNYIASTCFAIYDEPFEAEFVHDEKGEQVWKMVVNTAKCDRWRYTWIVGADGRLTGQRGTTTFELKPVQ